MVNYITTIINLLVPDKREPTTVAYLSPLATQIQIDDNVIFNLFKIGGTYPEWSAGTTYDTYDVVKYGKSIFYSAIDANLGNPPYVGSSQWVLGTNNFIGVDQRAYFNGTKLVFEYAINTFFGTVYQPDTSLNSEIYVETLAPKRKIFTVAITEKFCDSVLLTNSTGYIKLTDTEPDKENLIIWVKDLNTTGKPTSDEIKTFADRYIVAGVIYRIQSY